MLSLQLLSDTSAVLSDADGSASGLVPDAAVQRPL